MKKIPLAEQLRPHQLNDVIGQRHLIGSGKPLSRMSEKKHLHSMILWGPPDTGKTTLAHILAETCNMPFVSLSAIFSGVADLKKKQNKLLKRELPSFFLLMKFIVSIVLSKIDFCPMLRRG